MPPKDDDLIQRIQSDDLNVRGDAWQGAGDARPAVIPQLARLVTSEDFEVGRAAKRAIWQIVRQAGRPDTPKKRKNRVVAMLAKLLDEAQPVALRREVLWMLSELADGGAVLRRAAVLLAHEDLREDVRCLLERIPGDESLAALRVALEKAPEDFKPAVAQSLRARGVKVEGVPCLKLTPTRATGVAPVGA